jgi:hypothetical protein
MRRILDNLPLAMIKMHKSEKTNEERKGYVRGFPVGFQAGMKVGGRVASALLPRGLHDISHLPLCRS